MNKNDLVNKVSDGTGLSKTDSAKAVDSVFDTIMSELKKKPWFNSIPQRGFPGPRPHGVRLRAVCPLPT